MSLDIYNDAFKSLSILNEDLFDTSTLGVQKLQSFLDDDLDGEDEIEVIDAEADTTDDLANSYVGKVIVDCNVCHSHIFKDREDIDIDDSGLVNGEDACPYCGEQEGFVIIGQIEEFNENGGEEENEPTEEPEAAEVPEVDERVEEDGDKEKNESLKSLRKKQPITEELNECGTLEEEASGDGLANRVLAYLDRLEARGELTESMNNVKVETDDNVVTVNSDEDGKVTVTTEPLSADDFSGEGEMITPLSDEDMDTMIDSDEVPADVDFGTDEIEPVEEDEIDIDMEEVDEDSVNELGESYLRKVYENVASYKTRNSYVRGNSLILEGVITFTSGKKKTTGFVLEAYSANRYGKVSFRGYNSHLAKDKSSYLFGGRVKDKKLIMESLSYRYKLNEDLVKGKVKRK